MLIRRANDRHPCKTIEGSITTSQTIMILKSINIILPWSRTYEPNPKYEQFYLHHFFLAHHMYVRYWCIIFSPIVSSQSLKLYSFCELSSKFFITILFAAISFSPLIKTEIGLNLSAFRNETSCFYFLIPFHI